MVTSTSTAKDKNNDAFEALEFFSIKSSEAGTKIIESMASERVNAFNWKGLNINNNKLTQYIMDHPWLIEEFYDVSRRSLLKESVGFIIVDNYIEPCTINNYSMITRNRKIVKALVSVAKWQYKDSKYLIQYEYDVSKTEVIHHMTPIGDGTSIKKADEIKFFEEEGKGFKNKWNPSKDGIPLVIWKSFPKNTNFYDIAIEKAEKLNIVNDIIVDQLLNGMQKKQEFNSDMQTGVQTDTTDAELTKQTFRKLTTNVNSMTSEEWAKQIALYSPNPAILKEYRDTADWFEQDIKKHGKAIKDDDDDSAQKNNAELININRSATDALELNKDQYENNIKELIMLFDPAVVRTRIEVELPFRTIAKTMLDNTKEIMVKTSQAETKEVEHE